MFQSVRGVSTRTVARAVVSLNKTHTQQRLLSDHPLRLGIGHLNRKTTPDLSVMASKADDVKGEMLEPSVANKPLVRFAALAAIVAASAKATGFLTVKSIGFIHMMAFGAWFGTLVWTSFIFGLVAFKTLARQTFGKLQSKLFPKYFALTGAAPGLMLATLHYLTGGAPPVTEVRLLGISVACAVANLLVAEPAATSVMFERYALENAEGERDEGRIAALKKTFGKWHGISSLLNLVVLVCAVGHAYYLGGQLSFM
eukprot:jgi/Picre1/32446/NNA_007792.t1